MNLNTERAELQAVPEQVWDIEDCARFLKVSTKTVRVLVRREGLPCFRLRSRLRFLPPAVLQWAAMRQGREGR
jgi:hypothetical protein